MFFYFRRDQYLFKIPSYFRVNQNSSPQPPEPPYFFKKLKIKNYKCIKKVHDIYFIKYVNYFHKALQGSEYAGILNKPGFWIYLWFWIYQGSEYVRVTQGSEYAWLCLAEYAWICLNQGVDITVNFRRKPDKILYFFCFLRLVSTERILIYREILSRKKI